MILLLLFVQTVTAIDLFTAVVHLENLLTTEKNLMEGIDLFIEYELNRINRLKSIRQEISNFLQSTNASDIAKNPVLTFQSFKRIADDFRRVEPIVIEKRPSEGALLIAGLADRLPKEDDISGAARALFRLQDTYRLPAHKLVSGTLPGMQETHSLTAADCFTIGRIAYFQNDHTHSAIWMQEALRLLDAHSLPSVSSSASMFVKSTLGIPESVDEEAVRMPKKSEVLDFLSYSLYSKGHIRKAYQLTDELLLLDPFNTRAQSNRRYYEGFLHDQATQAAKRGDVGTLDTPDLPEFDTHLDEMYGHYTALCRGESPQPIADAHKLSCFYLNNGNPWLWIQRVKVETLHNNPWIALFHDIISDNEIATVQSLAVPKLDRSAIFSKDDDPTRKHFTESRISESAWLADHEHELMKRLTHRVGAVSMIDMRTAELLQVLNYGLAGHYEPHYDFARPDETRVFDMAAGNRIATWLFYMSDVEAGGATVFPAIGAKVFPKKGAAVLWFNMLRNGIDGDYRTFHAGCPVLAGSKWIANKWVHVGGQEVMRPCGRTETATFTESEYRRTTYFAH